jgi:hypothetical protein
MNLERPRSQAYPMHRPKSVALDGLGLCCLEVALANLKSANQTSGSLGAVPIETTQGPQTVLVSPWALLVPRLNAMRQVSRTTFPL